MTEPQRAPLIEVHDGPAALATAVAGELLTRLVEAQARGAVPHISLTGGGIAEAIHREVTRLAPASDVDWGRVHAWWGDERFVGPDDEQRNALAVRRDLLDRVGIDPAHVHEMPSTATVPDVHAGAAAYAALLGREGPDLFEVVMLGVGPDGHIASLFPGRHAVTVTEVDAVAVTDSPKPPPERISLTLPRLNRARSVWLLVSGSAKADAVAAALAGGSSQEIPARGVSGRDETVWFLDRESAARL